MLVACFNRARGSLTYLMYMTLPECMTLPDIWPTTIFSVKLMHLCIRISERENISYFLEEELLRNGSLFACFFQVHNQFWNWNKNFWAQKVLYQSTCNNLSQNVEKLTKVFNKLIKNAPCRKRSNFQSFCKSNRTPPFTISWFDQMIHFED